MKLLRAFTTLENKYNYQSEFRAYEGEDDWGHYYKIEINTDGRWKEDGKIYGDKKTFEKYIKEWESEEEEWGI